MPVPRRFDRQPPERDTTRINERIRVPEVRLIDETGQQVGVMRTQDALRQAQEKDLDLVEVAPDAKPPVVRILDYSKYKYEQAQKVKQARKHQQQITVREIKFRPKIAQHDFDTKKGHVERFLRNKDKVKVTIMFRGREVTHPDRGVAILDRLAEELGPLSVVEQRPMQDGRNMTMMLGPSKAVLAGTLEGGESAEPAEAAAGAEASAATTEASAASAGSAAASARPADNVATEGDVAARAEVDLADEVSEDLAHSQPAARAQSESAGPAGAAGNGASQGAPSGAPRASVS